MANAEALDTKNFIPIAVSTVRVCRDARIFLHENHDIMLTTLRAKESLKLVAVVVPLSNRKELTQDETISLNHLLRFLRHYDKYIVIPESLVVDLPSFGVKVFNDKYFGSVAAHNQLMLSSVFYEAFAAYKYVLIYHLDALVFSDQLTEWCDTNLDFISPPWVIRLADSTPVGFSRCGNGGFSLRKIDAFLKVINSRGLSVTAEEAWRMICARRSRLRRILIRPVKYIMHLKGAERSRLVRSLYLRNEDRFWSDQAKLFYPCFRVTPVEVGLRFGFDDAPRYCFARNDNALPFGCHGWYKYDRDFWGPYLIR